MSHAAFTAHVLAYADRHSAEDQPLVTPVAGLTVMRSRTPTTLSCVVYYPLVCLILQGEKQLSIGAQVLTFGCRDSLIVSHDLPSISRVTKASPAEPYVSLAFALDLPLLHDLAMDIGSSSHPEEPASPLAIAGADAALFDAFVRLFALIDQPQAMPVLAPLITKEIHYWLLAAGHGAMLRNLTRPDSRAARIARAIAVIKHEFTAPLAAADLARTAGMSLSGFFAAFKGVTGTTPLHFQKDLRLMEARRLLRTGTATVSSAAFQVGYESPTQFAREYGRKFGQPPRHDLTRQTAARPAVTGEARLSSV